jgi:hypothetical protein
MAVGLLGVGACAALNTPGVSDTERTYGMDMQLVIDNAVDTYQEVGMEIEDQFWEDGDTYVISGHQRHDMVRSSGEGVQVTAMVVTITRLGETQTHVRAETSLDDLPAAASSADRRTSYARRFFDRLDARFE